MIGLSHESKYFSMRCKKDPIFHHSSSIFAKVSYEKTING
jgi:hypothetical protein